MKDGSWGSATARCPTLLSEWPTPIRYPGRVRSQLRVPRGPERHARPHRTRLGIRGATRQGRCRTSLTGTAWRRSATAAAWPRSGGRCSLWPTSPRPLARGGPGGLPRAGGRRWRPDGRAGGAGRTGGRGGRPLVLRRGGRAVIAVRKARRAVSAALPAWLVAVLAVCMFILGPLDELAALLVLGTLCAEPVRPAGPPRPAVAGSRIAPRRPSVSTPEDTHSPGCTRTGSATRSLSSWRRPGRRSRRSANC
jgi:hypothetical protein